ncbi:glycosyltransferase family 4 protein [Sulfuracidifex metallicus]|uniref:glycosyltransferase family 4 protein n=1 Tax=Sulfuracidifex metallicus TaxID=47303 RepID=UPI0022723600|nr:glycosyltransferase family 4 protein [Sulfuracidifex metallicus]MCY0850998.1 glycosyltransferase family 4 protein [Sulfuracidifex metallicus]
MKIVQVAPFYYPVLGGVEKVVSRISEYMVSKGNEVTVVTYNRDRSSKGMFKEREIINGVEVVRLSPKITMSHGSYSPDVVRVVKSIDPDIVHVHVWRHPHSLQLSSLDLVKVLHPHSPFYSRKQVGSLIYVYYNLVDSIFRKRIRDYNIISISPIEKEIIKKKFNVNSTVIPNGVEDSYFDVKSQGDNFYLFLGRLSAEKNVMRMLRGYKLSEVKRPLVIAGPDEGIGKEVKEYIERYQLNAKYVGPVSEEEKINLLSHCRALINPRPYEAFGINLVEAEAVGKPCIIVGHGGQEYVAPPGVSSVRSNDTDEGLANSFREMEKDDVFFKLSRGAKNYAERFRMSRILSEIEKYYNSLLKGVESSLSSS